MSNAATNQQFDADMTVGDALRLHPQARQIMANFHLGGCSHCAMNEEETIAQVSEGYGVNRDQLLDALNGLLA